MSGEDISNAVIIEIFAGTSRVTACLRQIGLRSCFGVDHVKVKNLSGPVSVADLTTPEGVSLLMSWINTRVVLGIFLAPPCGTASRARAIKLRRGLKRKFQSDPVPLRSDRQPNGVSGLSWLNKFKISKANKLYHLTAQIVKHCVKHGLLVCVENPQYSLFWATSFWQEVAHLVMYSTFHTCQYGSKRLKRTMLAHNHLAFSNINMKCPGVSSTHRHEKWGLTKTGFATQEETAYPFILARAIAHAFTTALLELKLKAPAEVFHQLQSDSSQVLQAIRGQTGLQPKAQKLPPIVPEHQTLIQVTNSRDRLPSSQLAFRFKAAVAVTCTASHKTITLPAYSKLVTEQLTNDAKPQKGDESSGICSESSSSVVRQTWAIPWSPMQFVTEAAKSGHPASIESFAPPVLHEVTEFYSKTKVHDRIKYRADQIKYWVDRCKTLAVDESKVHEKLPSHAKKLMRNKRFLLWQEMLQSCGYQDMGVVAEMQNGIHLTGETSRTNLWPEKFTPAAISCDELSEIGRRDRQSVINKPIVAEDNEVNQAVWQQTLEEVQEGFVEGPYPMQSIPADVPVSKRFGVVQGSKVRCVDDFTGSSINLAVQSCESPRPHTLDVVAGLTSIMMKKSKFTKAWVGRVFDLKSAYRQCFIHEDSLKYSFIGVYDPNDGVVKAFRMLALPFGNIKSVHSFLRISHSLWFLGSKLFKIPWTNFFDDFVTIADESEASSMTETVHCLFRLLGWKFAEGGSKAPPFNKTFSALGVNIDVSSMARGEVKIDNTESRKKDLCETIGTCLKTTKLSRHDALRLRGRMQFTSGQIYGRVAKTCLGHVTMHAYSTTGVALSPSTTKALTLYMNMLTSQGPRSLSCRSTNTWYFFTDASFEVENDIPYSGYGGVLVSPDGRPTRFFSGDLSGNHVALLNPKGLKTIIFECEFLAVLIAYKVWAKEVAGSQLVVFIDNNAVRDSLISCDTSNATAAKILKSILQLEDDVKALAWYTRVPSPSNIADDPSRKNCSFLKSLKCQEDKINMDEILASLALE